MTDRMIPVEDGPYTSLRCPSCGNPGESPFCVDTLVVVGGDGMVLRVAQYTDVPDALMGCFACDYLGPLESFIDLGQDSSLGASDAHEIEVKERPSTGSGRD